MGEVVPPHEADHGASLFHGDHSGFVDVRASGVGTDEVPHTAGAAVPAAGEEEGV